MLNKDQYNQDEYNDYYRQEVEGSELGSSSSKDNKFVGKFITLLSLLALAIASYFGYKAFSNTSISDNNHTTNVPAKETTSSLPTSVQEKSTAIESPKVKMPIDKMPKNKTIQEKGVEKNSIEKKPIEKKPLEEKPVEKKALEEKSRTTQSKVTKVVESQSKMSPEEVAAVVAAVMKQMSQTKSNNSTTVETPNKQDLNLMNKLTDLEVDPISKDLMDELGKAEVNEDAKIDNSDKKIDVYNKVNVQNTTTDVDTDILSKLSDEINSVITQETTSNNTDKSYTESLKDEVDVRKNEMRIIVVREGDTLGKIARRAYGNAREFKKIYEANPEVTRPDRIYIGQKLRIPN